MVEADLTIPVSPLDSAICDAVSKLELAVDRGADVTREQMHIVSRSLWQAMERDRQRRAEQLLAADAGQPRDDFTAFKRRLAIMADLSTDDLAAAGIEHLDIDRLHAGRVFQVLLALSPLVFQRVFALIQERERAGA